MPPSSNRSRLPMGSALACWTPRGGRRDLRDRDQRAGAYAQVLDEGTPADIRIWIDPHALADLWPDVPVARHLRGPVAEMVAGLR